jgi:hypothetical protein
MQRSWGNDYGHKMKSITVPPNYLVTLGLSAPLLRNKFLDNVEIGECFQFTVGGEFYIRCRGGYRPGRGGELVKHSHDQMVYVECTK